MWGGWGWSWVEGERCNVGRCVQRCCFWFFVLICLIWYLLGSFQLFIELLDFILYVEWHGGFTCAWVVLDILVKYYILAENDLLVTDPPEAKWLCSWFGTH